MKKRRIFLNAVWDGSLVWLVVFGGALFAGFPDVYATLFSGFYDFCMILLAALIFRATAIEFRSKRESKRWRFTWDAVFSIASLLIAFGLGLAIGNLMEGIPLDKNEDFACSSAVCFRPFPILIGFFTVSLLLMHGSIYLAMKTRPLAPTPAQMVGPLHGRFHRLFCSDDDRNVVSRPANGREIPRQSLVFACSAGRSACDPECAAHVHAQPGWMGVFIFLPLHFLVTMRLRDRHVSLILSARRSIPTKIV